MKIKTSEASGPVLDWMVAKCEGFGPDQYMKNIDIRFDVNGKASCLLVPINRVYVQWSPSTNWAQGGPLLNYPEIGVVAQVCDSDQFCAYVVDGYAKKYYPADTLLKAICIAFVALKIGEEVEVPDELIDEPRTCPTCGEDGGTSCGAPNCGY